MKILLLTLFPFYIYSQCSDAGVCTIAEHNENQQSAFRTGLTYNFGYSGKEDDISYSSIILDANYFFTENSSVYFSLPYNIQTGPLGKISGLGDLIIAANQSVYNSGDFRLNLQAGIKLPTGDDNSEKLPQAYQSGLGTTDFLFGVSLAYNNFNAAVGYQIAGGRNDNIQMVKRGDDFLLSAGYKYYLTEDLSANFQLLMIKRLAETSMAGLADVFIDIPGSDNLQVNAALTISWKISETSTIQLFAAVPFRKRPDNTDGLTRALTMSAGYFINF